MMRFERSESETILGAAADIAAGRRSCAEVLEGCLGRIEEREGEVRAWVVVDREGAWAQAEARDRELAEGRSRGPLHGIPLGIKDIVDVAGLPTACGVGAWSDRVAREDAPLVARLREAGAVIVGKTVTTPFAWIDPPPTRNPWDLGRTPGGSSSGSAAALACGMALGAIGSQTGGSITRPASFCGVAGLKPTHGRLSLEGILPFAPSLDHPGPMARTAGDLVVLWEVLVGGRSEAGISIPPSPPLVKGGALRGSSAGPGEGRIRLGRLRGLFEERADGVMNVVLGEALRRLEAAGVEVVEVRLSEGFDRVIGWHRTVMAAEAATVHRDSFASRAEIYPERIRALIEEGMGVSQDGYLEAKSHQRPMAESLVERLSGLDAFVTPAAVGAAPGPETTGDPVMNAPWSFTGLPTVTFPMGVSPEGLPLGMQLAGRPFEESGLLGIAVRCEAALWAGGGQG